MATRYGKESGYVDAITRDKLNAVLNKEGISHASLAYQLRMTRTHISGMLGGSKKMAQVHLLAMQFVVLKHRAEGKATDAEEFLPTASASAYRGLRPRGT